MTAAVIAPGLPCPAWCAGRDGHPDFDEWHAETSELERYHWLIVSDDHAKVGVSAYLPEMLRPGRHHAMGAGYVHMVLEDNFDGDLTPAEARAVAAALLRAVELLEATRAVELLEATDDA